MKKQRGGSGASLFSSSFHAQTAVGGNAAITRAGLATIEQAPMFNPLADNTVFPTDSTGIVPPGLYYANIANTSTPFTQLGGGPSHSNLKKTSLNKMAIHDLRNLCNNLNISCRSSAGKFLSKQILIARILSSNAQQIGNGSQTGGNPTGMPWQWYNPS